MEQNKWIEVFFASLPDFLGFKTESIYSYYMDLSPVQDSFRYRAKRVALEISTRLIDERGELNRAELDQLLMFFNEGPFMAGPGRVGDVMIYEHIQNCLKGLLDQWVWIKKMTAPLSHKGAEEIIRDSLFPLSFRKVETYHVRRAVLASWLTLLRQSTGSCFATAPAILIQKNSPELFFKDIYDLLSMGQLKRVVAGKEYIVPMALNTGKGELQRQSGLPLEYCPGFWAALEAADLLDPSISIEEKVGKVRGLIKEYREDSNVELVIRSVLLISIGITEEDIESEDRLADIQMTPLLAKQNAIFYQRLSPRGEKVADLKKKFTRACKAFVAFTECALLRSWEYSLASLCDVKVEFARWNLYIGLGLESKGDGIGAFLYNKINDLLQKCNREIERLSFEYEERLSGIAALEVMYEEALNPDRRHQLKTELSAQMMGVESILNYRKELGVKGEAIAAFYPSLIEQYDQKLQESFQELFDPSILGEQAHLYDDSPAGFRLVYKHGRSDASQWTAIYTEDQYIDSLRDFFSSVENELLFPPAIGREFITEITTSLILFIREPIFLASAKRRSRGAGRNSPWDYISGGTMQGLVQAYCSREVPFKEEKIVPHHEGELLEFLIQNKKGKAPLLIHSPTHAFIFYPDLLPVDCDRLLKKNREFIEKWSWNEVMQEHVSHKLSLRLPEMEKQQFLHLFRRRGAAQSKVQFRENLIQSLSPQIKEKETLVDAVLFEEVPLLNRKQAQEVVEKVFLKLGVIKKADVNGEFLNPSEIHQIIQSTLLKSGMGPFSKNDLDQKIVYALRELEAAYPHPILFADTNWSGWFFGFILNPVSGDLELWRLNRVATVGFPMSDWKEYLNSQNKSPWVLLLDFYQFIFSL